MTNHRTVHLQYCILFPVFRPEWKECICPASSRCRLPQWWPKLRSIRFCILSLNQTPGAMSRLYYSIFFQCVLSLTSPSAYWTLNMATTDSYSCHITTEAVWALSLSNCCSPDLLRSCLGHRRHNCLHRNCLLDHRHSRRRHHSEAQSPSFSSCLHTDLGASWGLSSIPLKYHCSSVFCNFFMLTSV